MTIETNLEVTKLAKEKYEGFLKAFPYAMSNINETLFEVIFIEAYLAGQQKEREDANVFLKQVTDKMLA